MITSGGTGDAVMMFENASGNTWGHGIWLTNNNIVAYNRYMKDFVSLLMVKQK